MTMRRGLSVTLALALRRGVSILIAATLIILSLIFGGMLTRVGATDLSCVEEVQLTLFIATLPWAVGFIALYARDRWWHSPFGWSLMLLAIAVALYSASAVLFRMFGQDYPGRDLLIITSSALTFVAIVLRTLVLRNVQRNERR